MVKRSAERELIALLGWLRQGGRWVRDHRWRGMEQGGDDVVGFTEGQRVGDRAQHKGTLIYAVTIILVKCRHVKETRDDISFIHGHLKM